jgi:hypothetical protein
MFDLMFSHSWQEQAFAEYVNDRAEVEVGGLFIVVQKPLMLPREYSGYVDSEWQDVRFIEHFVFAPNVSNYKRGEYNCQSWRALREYGEAAQAIYGGQYLEFHSHPSGWINPSPEDYEHVDGKPFCIVTAPLRIRTFFYERGAWVAGSWLSWADTKWGRGVNLNHRAKVYGEVLVA